MNSFKINDKIQDYWASAECIIFRNIILFKRIIRIHFIISRIILFTTSKINIRKPSLIVKKIFDQESTQKTNCHL